MAALVLAVGALVPAEAGAQEGGAAEEGPLAELAFMSGCWLGGEATLIEERWTPPSENVMLGTTRYLRDGRTVQFELSTIVAEAEGVTLLPYPGGRPSEDGFRLTRTAEGMAIFEAPEHDYPKRIVYRRTAEGLVARIDGGADDPDPREWTMAPASCTAEAGVTPG